MHHYPARSTAATPRQSRRRGVTHESTRPATTPIVITPIVPSVPAMKRPRAVRGVMSPYPIDAAVITDQYSPSRKERYCRSGLDSTSTLTAASI
jgi:hypothetical protein